MAINIAFAIALFFDSDQKHEVLDFFIIFLQYQEIFSALFEESKIFGTFHVIETSTPSLICPVLTCQKLWLVNRLRDNHIASLYFFGTN